ncbi:hypothetical protein MM300_20275 [Evansella sp. LMS18]|uniref:hypothetical protein n=1 Tax=Evansella sp. LMS18 TaxID=2924033 RepID=UPI0020D1AA9D|nr:hypothetical protein [Evansella sp. LMS18]UTR10186.1 hypothetical protein MM300_20275 [Evansella sp. LMS18]
MAACLVEDETSDNALLHDPESMGLKRGIAWWGEGTGDNKTQPLTNESEIMEILNVLNIEPFKEEETGTSIILPYINEEKILESVTAKYKNTEKVPKWWETTVEDYIKVTVQRWYAPRIMNLNYPFGRALRPMINGRVINQDEMLPLFRIIQALYNKTPLRIGAEREDPILKGIKTNVEKVLLRNVFSKTGTAGYIAFTKLTREQLLMLAPDNHPSPLEQADIQEEFNGETNPPIITYVRKPGMLINYETSGPWVEGIGDSSEKEFLIGIFVANSENMLKDEIAKISLEEYIRKSEKADHTSWSNWNVGDYNPLIISKIQRQSKKHIRDQFTEVKKDSKENKKLGLGRALAEVLLPPEDFGSKSNVPRRTGVGGTSSSNKKSYGLKILGEPEFTEGEIELNFQLNFGKKTQTVDLELRVLSETGNILANSWEGESGIGTAFPLQITSIQLTKIFTGKEKHPEELTNFSFPVNMNSVSVKNLSFETLYTEEFGVPYGIKVSVPELTGYSIEGAVRFKTKQLKIQGILSVVKDEGGAS